MFHYLLGSLILICTVMTFHNQYQIRGALNAYYGLYKGIVETSVVAYDASGKKIHPYFEQDRLVDRVMDYFQDNLKPYCRVYLMNIHFSSFIPNAGPSKVEIELDITFNDISTMNKKAIFEIRSNVEHE